MISRGAACRSCTALLSLITLFGGQAVAVEPGENAGSAATPPAAAPIASESADRAPAPPRLFIGQVVYLKDALAKRGIETAEETAQHVVLETDGGDVIPILADWRGRAFYQDEQLRNRQVELIGFQQTGVPYLNVIAVYTFDEQQRRNYTDYWCDICSIPMYEIQACECCQGPIRLRFQLQDLPDDVTNAASPRKSP